MMNKAKSESSNSSIQLLAKKKLQKIKSSFFDDKTTKNSSLWTPILSQNVQASTIERDIEGILFKETKRGTIKEKYISICGDRLVMFEQNGKISKKFFDLNNSLLEKLTNEDGPEVYIFLLTKKRHGFRITKNQQCVDFYTQGLQVSDIWYNFLKRSCIQRSFQHAYNINKLIGKGNFAKVYSATNKYTNRQVAVKAFDKDKFTDVSVDKPALIKELSIMRKMDHKGVLKLYEVFENEAYIFLVCEFLEGGEFFFHLKKAINYDEHLLAAAVYNMLQAIEYIHSKGVLHRDIKPENIILRTKGDIKDICIADFGLADYYNPKGDYQFKRCGTPGYVAPELLQDKIYDYKIDIFSIGVLMFIMLSGTSPFQAQSYNDIVMKNYNCEINYNVNGLNNKISPEASELLHDLLDKNPNLRPTATMALKYKWFEIHINTTQKSQTQFLTLDGPLPRFNHQDNPELYSKTPLMNQDLCLSINSTPLGVTPQVRSKSNTQGIENSSNTDNQDNNVSPPFQFQQKVKLHIGPKHTNPEPQQKELDDDYIDEGEFNVGEETPQSGQIKKYQLLTKMKRYVIPEKNESSENLSIAQHQPQSNVTNVRTVLKDFEKQ